MNEGIDETERSLSIGAIIDDRYQITEKLGEGGMGAVFIAEHLKLKKPVALKIVRPGFAGDEEVEERFAREALVGAKIDHPHVATAMDYGTLADGGAYLVMQLVRGVSLHQLLVKEGSLHWRRACELGSQIADALAAVHAAGIIHRDLKPDNVIVEQRDNGSDFVRILDFGIARLTETGDEQPAKSLTKVGIVVGTPGYMAPEQAMGTAVDHRADLYALGLLIWEMIAGHALFQGEDLTAIVSAQLTEHAPSLKALLQQSDFPTELDVLITKLLSRQAQDRPNSASEVRDTLRKMLGGTQERIAIAPTHLQHGSVSSNSPSTASAWMTAFTSLRSRWISVGVVAVLIFAAWMLKQKGKSTNASSLPATHTETPTQEVIERIDQLASTTREERTEAANWLIVHQPSNEVPAYARLMAELEISPGCRTKNQVIERIDQLGDSRTVPALQRLAAKPKRGCGFLGLKDCYSCLRGTLAKTLAKLKASDEQD